MKSVIIQIKISGCINACGHHHVGTYWDLRIRTVLVLKNYQITLGGDATETAKIGDRAGPGFSATQIVPAVERIILTYLKVRLNKHENFHTYISALGDSTLQTSLIP